ncbi:GPW/gp25 family protein [Maridesulfovibrio ferrireducens]|uniref:GPW/gp25 family protein n=1 Tax=Maridesulfovibrio ferrireducens TaxID=246191 RepID=UPI001A31EBEF|nr:GPW/gp25 family protein [Maridesulfovibrio ferrireducens]MBI9112241.1 GPW/gp25 family protein [Maridesulfovibrio ferrireducens]
METVVDTRTSNAIVIGATGIAEILQNVRTILSTIKGEVPLDRTFGLSITYLDRPIPEAMAAFSGEIVEEVERQEPRISVTRVKFLPKEKDAMQGRLYPVVRIKIKDGAL